MTNKAKQRRLHDLRVISETVDWLSKYLHDPTIHKQLMVARIALSKERDRVVSIIQEPY